MTSSFMLELSSFDDELLLEYCRLLHGLDAGMLAGVVDAWATEYRAGLLGCPWLFSMFLNCFKLGPIFPEVAPSTGCLSPLSALGYLSLFAFSPVTSLFLSMEFGLVSGRRLPHLATNS